MLVDTGKPLIGDPVQTSFHLPPLLGDFGYPPFLLENGAHKPCPTESMAPFYQDPAQRVVALQLPDSFGYLILRIGALSKLLEGSEGSEIGWDEWKSHVVIPSIDPDRLDLYHIWVSGCRLFFLNSPSDDQVAHMEVYDFSVEGRAKYLSHRDNSELDGLRYLSSTGVKVRLPWRVDDLAGVRSSHESIIFSCVSLIVPRSIWEYKLTCIATQYLNGVDSDDRILHIWAF